MSTRQPTISVGMPVYNGEQYLALSIDSVLAQSYGDFELIISDNASSDATESICRRYAGQDSRIRYVRNERNIGASGNYNQLFRLARGRYFRWFNADDLSSPRLHELCLKTIEEHPDASMVYGKTDIIDGEGRFLSHYEDRLDLRQESAAERFMAYFKQVGLTNAIYGLMRCEALGRTGLMGNGRFPAVDTNLMAELALQGKLIEIPETLFYRRMHEQCSSWDRSKQSVQQQFWMGSNSKFVMPTLKREWALWSAIDAAPAGLAEKLRLKAYMLRRFNWSRRDISCEIVQALRPRTAASG
jgi:glycosyltransferase involved in cell wall biosynthesis